MKYRTLASFLLIFASSTLYAAADISGSYHCIGYDPYTKTNYDSDLVIVKTGDAYSFKWKEGGAEYSGTGLASKKNENIIAAEFWSPIKQDHSGVIIYQKKNNSFEGEWVVTDKNLIGTETCLKQHSG